MVYLASILLHYFLLHLLRPKTSLSQSHLRLKEGKEDAEDDDTDTIRQIKYVFKTRWKVPWTAEN